jgi:hypothetical protein
MIALVPNNMLLSQLAYVGQTLNRLVSHNVI